AANANPVEYVLVTKVAQTDAHGVYESSISGPHDQHAAKRPPTPKIAVEMIVGPVAPFPRLAIRFQTESNRHDDKVGTCALWLFVLGTVRPGDFPFTTRGCQPDVAYAPSFADVIAPYAFAPAAFDFFRNSRGIVRLPWKQRDRCVRVFMPWFRPVVD